MKPINYRPLFCSSGDLPDHSTLKSQRITINEYLSLLYSYVLVQLSILLLLPNYVLIPRYLHSFLFLHHHQELSLVTIFPFHSLSLLLLFTVIALCITLMFPNDSPFQIHNLRISLSLKIVLLMTLLLLLKTSSLC